MDISGKIKVVCNQTNYTQREAEEKLKDLDFDVEKVILDYMGGSKEVKKEISNNQKFFKAMRELY